MMRILQRFRQVESLVIRNVIAFATFSFATTIAASYVFAFQLNRGGVVDAKFPTPTALFQAQLIFCLPAVIFFSVLFALGNSATAICRRTTSSPAMVVCAGLAGIAVPLVMILARAVNSHIGLPAAALASIFAGVAVCMLPSRSGANRKPDAERQTAQ